MITQSNKLFTWGASPQLIRLVNQSRKRERLARKFEETKTVLSNELNDDTTETSAKHTKDAEDNKIISGSNNNVAEENNSTIDNQYSGNEQIASSEPRKHKHSKQQSQTHLEDKIKNFLRSKSHSKSSTSDATSIESKVNDEFYMDDEYTDHFLPIEVDTSDVTGEIVQVKANSCFDYIDIKCVNFIKILEFNRFQVGYIIML